MKFRDLNGNIQRKNISKYKRLPDQISKSKGQNELANILINIWPNTPIYEELLCVGTKLKLDLFIDSLKIAFEFDGSQHEEFNPFFHGDRLRWLQSKNRDDLKEQWCKQNGIKLIRITEKDLDVNRIRGLIRDSCAGSNQ